MSKKKPLILIVDDNPKNLQVFTQLIESNGYDTAIALNGEQALDFVESDTPDLILLDIMMPGIDGFEVCRKLKENSRYSNIPVIFLTAKIEKEDIIRGFEVGAVDYISKPFNSYELIARIRTHVELSQSRRNLLELNKKLEKANRELIILNQKLKKRSITDTLTGLYNRRYMMKKLKEEKNRCERNNRCFSVIISDIDNFKKFNDKYGHDCGDYVLKAITQTMQDSIRKQDILSRWGGEEFLFLLPETDGYGAEVLGEKVRSKIEKTKYKYEDLELSVTMTFGIAEFSCDIGIDKTIKKADEALMKGKETGKNKVVR